MNKISKEELEEVINEFQYEGKLVFIKPYGSGHINDTFCRNHKVIFDYLFKSSYMPV